MPAVGPPLACRRGYGSTFWFQLKSAVLHWKVYTWAATLCGVGSTRKQEEESKSNEQVFVASIRFIMAELISIFYGSSFPIPIFLEFKYFRLFKMADESVVVVR